MIFKSCCPTPGVFAIECAHRLSDSHLHAHRDFGEHENLLGPCAGTRTITMPEPDQQRRQNPADLAQQLRISQREQDIPNSPPDLFESQAPGHDLSDEDLHVTDGGQLVAELLTRDISEGAAKRERISSNTS